MNNLTEHTQSQLPLLFSLMLPYISSSELLVFCAVAKVLQPELQAHIIRQHSESVALQRFIQLKHHENAARLPMAVCELFNTLLTEAASESATIALIKETLEALYLRWPGSENLLLLDIDYNLEDTSDDPALALLGKIHVLAVLPNPLLEKFHSRFLDMFFRYCTNRPLKWRSIGDITDLLPLSLVFGILRELPKQDQSQHNVLLQISLSRILDIFLQLPTALQQQSSADVIPLLSTFFTSNLLDIKTRGYFLKLLYHIQRHSPAILLREFETGANIANFLGNFCSADATFANTKDLQDFFLPLLAFYSNDPASREIARTLLVTFFHNQSILCMQKDHAAMMHQTGQLLLQNDWFDKTARDAILRYSQSNPLAQGGSDHFLLHLNLFELIGPAERGVLYPSFLKLCEQTLCHDPVLFFRTRQGIRDFFANNREPQTIPTPKTLSAKVLYSFLYQSQLLSGDSESLSIHYDTDWEIPDNRTLLVIGLLLCNRMTTHWFLRVLEHISGRLASEKSEAHKGRMLLGICLEQLDARQRNSLQGDLYQFCLNQLAKKEHATSASAFWIYFEHLEVPHQQNLLNELWQKQKFIYFSDSNSRYLWQPERFDALIARVQNEWQNKKYSLDSIKTLGTWCANLFQAETLRNLVLDCIGHFALPDKNPVSLHSEMLRTLGKVIAQAILTTKQHAFCPVDAFWQKLLSVLDTLPAIHPQSFFLLFYLLENLQPALEKSEIMSIQERTRLLEKACYSAMLSYNNITLLPIRNSAFLRQLIIKYNAEHPDILSKLFRHQALRHGISTLLHTNPELFTEKQKNGLMQDDHISLQEKTSIRLALSFWEGCCAPKNKTPDQVTSVGGARPGVF